MCVSVSGVSVSGDIGENKGHSLNSNHDTHTIHLDIAYTIQLAVRHR